MLSSDNTFDNVIDYDDDHQATAPSAEAEKAAKAEELPDHLHQAARHAILLRARAGTGYTEWPICFEKKIRMLTSNSTFLSLT